MKRTLKNVFSPSLCFVILRCPYAYGCLNKSGTVEKSFFVIPKPINEEGKKRRFYLPPNRGFLRSSLYRKTVNAAPFTPRVHA